VRNLDLQIAEMVSKATMGFDPGEIARLQALSLAVPMPNETSYEGAGSQSGDLASVRLIPREPAGGQF
jgi:hypothetical protein